MMVASAWATKHTFKRRLTWHKLCDLTGAPLGHRGAAPGAGRARAERAPAVVLVALLVVEVCAGVRRPRESGSVRPRRPGGPRARILVLLDRRLVVDLVLRGVVVVMVVA